MFNEEVGIKFDVSGKELREHCDTKAKYHDERMKFYKEQSKKFKEEAQDIAQKLGNTYSNTTVQSNKERMESSARHHNDRVRFFKFAAAHLKEMDYKISRGEAVSFEMIPS